MAKPAKPERIVAATNRKARFHYFILETFEAGLQLKGPEVKSLRGGKASFEGTYASVDDDGIYLHKLYIAPYEHNTLEVLDPARKRKLLMHGREIRKLADAVKTKGLTVVPLEIYFRNGWAKVELGLAKGKKGADKRDDLKDKAQRRELERSFKGKFKL